MQSTTALAGVITIVLAAISFLLPQSKFHQQAMTTGDSGLVTSTPATPGAEPNQAYLALVSRNWAGLPDLVVADIAHGGTGHSCLGVFGLSYNVRITNQGEAPAGPFVVQLFVIEGVKEEPVAGLNTGAEIALRGQGTVRQIVVDLYDDVAESDETNNVVRPMYIPTPGPTCTPTMVPSP